MTLLSEHLHNARRGLFVGRTAERTLFEAALTAQEPPFSVLYIYGLGGVGKTMLLREFAALCVAKHAHVTRLDARNMDPSPEGFLRALSVAQALNVTKSNTKALKTTDAVAQLMGGHEGRHAILLDTYELLAPLDNWLREEFLPQLPDNVLVVIAGRQPP